MDYKVVRFSSLTSHERAKKKIIQGAYFSMEVQNALFGQNLHFQLSLACSCEILNMF